MRPVRLRILSSLRVFAVLGAAALAGPALAERGGHESSKPWPSTPAEVKQERARGKAFLKKAAREKGAVRTKSGMVFVPIAVGDGPQPKSTDSVTVGFTGARIDGTVFDASPVLKPVDVTLRDVIPCWSEGLQRMKVGGKAKLVCPPELAYGDGGMGGGVIPGGATLVFEVELLEVVGAK
jgi:FKBP-type peptidyl-prolyl cis-trans isomerase